MIGEKGVIKSNIWDNGKISNISTLLILCLVAEDSVWGSDDDTDIEHIYQHILHEEKKSVSLEKI